MIYLNECYGHLNHLKLDLGSGLYPKAGFIGIDNFVGIKAQTLEPESVDISKLNVIRHNLNEGIPFDSDSVDEIVTSHFLEHCPALDKVFEETHRVLKDKRIFEIIVPYANSAEGMYPGHNLFFTEDWFLKNILFNKFFEIKEITFYESEHYAKHKDKIRKYFSFDEARLFLFNCCWQMQIVSTCNKSKTFVDNRSRDIKYGVVPFPRPQATSMKQKAIGRIKALISGK